MQNAKCKSQKAGNSHFALCTLHFAFCTSPSTPHAISPRKPHRPAFTLLEVVISSALMAVVLGVIYMTIDVQLRVVDSSRTAVEEAQLARAVLHRMGDDIRAAVAYDPLQSDQTMQLPSNLSAADLKKALAASASADPALTANLGSSGGGSAAPAGGTSSGSGTSTTSPSTSTSSTSSADNVAPNPTPGLYGDTDWIQIDVSRLPRLDQMQSNVSQSPDTLVIDRLSDLKTVKYYVNSSDSGAVGAGSQGGSGLVRLEMDRAVTAYQAQQNGGVDTSSLNLQPLAPEVTAVQFDYFDGTEWQTYWDSQESGGLPWAIQITLSIVPQSARLAAGPSGQLGGAASNNPDVVPVIHTFMVYLPAARSTLVQSTDTTSTDSSSSGTSPGTTTPSGS
jgi:prepilin-type N-terminal cleavage/methylation domain-containing protein